MALANLSAWRQRRRERRMARKTERLLKSVGDRGSTKTPPDAVPGYVPEATPAE
jgi:hypothetical protein